MKHHTLGARARRLAWRLGWRAAVILVLGAVALTAWLDLSVRARFDTHQWALPAQIFARPLTLHAGLRMPPDAVVEELTAAGYERVGGRPARPGQFARSAGRLEIATRGFQFWDGTEPARRIQVGWQDAAIDSLADERGRIIDLIRLEPALVGKIFPVHREDRVLTRLKAYPPELVAGLVMVEDRDFFVHSGVSVRAVLRAVWANLRAGAAVQGGSTLTQQLAKNFFLTPERTLWRKVREAIIAQLLEYHYDKELILETYMNEIYLGQYGARAIHGFGSAAAFYFGRPVAELELHESALLIALVRGGTFYNPRRSPDRARDRRDLVLQIMAEQGVVTSAQAAAAAARGLGVRASVPPTNSAHPAFLELVRTELRAAYDDQTLRSGGLRVFTTLDPRAQRVAERRLHERLELLERSRRLPAQSLQGAVVMVAPASGEVTALVGGRDPRAPGFNRALHARRPIGSLIKPVVFLTALQRSMDWLDAPLRDEPVDLRLANGKRWQPRNYDGKTNGAVGFNEALARSLNLATVHLGLELGVSDVLETLAALGYRRPVQPLPAVLLGAVDMTPLEVAQIYQPLASEGFGTKLRAVRSVTDADGRQLERYALDYSVAAPARAVTALTGALSDVVAGGTARYAGRRLKGLRVAGKTGTTDGLRDSWFAGFGRDRLTVVWVGRDDNRPAGLSGSAGALRVWTDVMAEVGVRPLAVRAAALLAEAPSPERHIPTETVATRTPDKAVSVAKNACANGDDDWFTRLFSRDCGTTQTGDHHAGVATGGDR